VCENFWELNGFCWGKDEDFLPFFSFPKKQANEEEALEPLYFFPSLKDRLKFVAHWLAGNKEQTTTKTDSGFQPYYTVRRNTGGNKKTVFLLLRNGTLPFFFARNGNTTLL